MQFQPDESYSGFVRGYAAATQQAVFTDGRVNGVPASILVDTGSATTIDCGKCQGDARKLQQVSGGPIVVANGELYCQSGERAI